MVFKMKGSPLLKDKKVWKWNGEQITVDDSTLSGSNIDDLGNKTIEYNYIDKDGNKASETLYKNKPRKEKPAFEEGEGPKTPRDRPIEPERFYA